MAVLLSNLPFPAPPLNDFVSGIGLSRGCVKYDKFLTRFVFVKPEVSPSSSLARFPAEEILISRIQAGEINRHGGKREPGSGQQEAFNWDTSHRGEASDSLVN